MRQPISYDLTFDDLAVLYERRVDPALGVDALGSKFADFVGELVATAR